MHLPDGFLDTKTVIATSGLAAVGVGMALRQARQSLPPRRVPLLGLTAAFVFAAQMLNFPVAGGTSGHLLGGVLAAVLLGPSGAIVALAAVLIVQAFVFADGGLLALGANVFNMGVVGAGSGYAIYRPLARVLGGDRGRLGAAAFAAWCATVLAAITAAGELSLSGVVAWPVVFPAMAGVHMLVGVGEALITALVLLAILRTRPDLVEGARAAGPAGARLGEVVALGLVIALGLALFVSPWASAWPDGLERVAQTLGFAGRAATDAAGPAPLADYRAPGISSATWATGVAGLVGVLVVFVLALGLARVLVPEERAGRPVAGER
jgi:cobalt/nickel transport system permease protein